MTKVRSLIGDTPVRRDVFRAGEHLVKTTTRMYYVIQGERESASERVVGEGVKRV